MRWPVAAFHQKSQNTESSCVWGLMAPPAGPGSQVPGAGLMRPSAQGLNKEASVMIPDKRLKFCI